MLPIKLLPRFAENKHYNFSNGQKYFLGKGVYRQISAGKKIMNGTWHAASNVENNFAHSDGLLNFFQVVIGLFFFWGQKKNYN
jgi:hypothetical protein